MYVYRGRRNVYVTDTCATADDLNHTLGLFVSSVHLRDYRRRTREIIDRVVIPRGFRRKIIDFARRHPEEVPSDPLLDFSRCLAI